jgi:hypothetical protein
MDGLTNGGGAQHHFIQPEPALSLSKNSAPNNNYRIFQDGVILNEITYGAPLSGPFSFTFMNGIYVSNFSVTSP